jgi:hypothetical protein
MYCVTRFICGEPIFLGFVGQSNNELMNPMNCVFIFSISNTNNSIISSILILSFYWICNHEFNNPRKLGFTNLTINSNKRYDFYCFVAN